MKTKTPKMSRAHFQYIADAFADTRPDPTNLPEYDQWASMVDTFTRRLMATNPLFKAGRFVDACDKVS